MCSGNGGYWSYSHVCGCLSCYEFGLKLKKRPSYVQSVSSKVQAIVGMAYYVSTLTGCWIWKHKLMVMPFGDFEIILGIDFLRKYIFVPFSQLDRVMIMNEINPSFVKDVHPYGEADKIAKYKSSMLSAIVVDKGLRKVEITFLAALVESKPDVKVEVLDCVAELLKQFVDVMPPEFSKNMWSRRHIDHKIELLSDLIVHTEVPYHMAPKELAELHKQLNEFLDVGLVLHSKALYGALDLFQKKQDGSMRMCVDYRALDKATVKNKYPVPLVQDLMDKLSKAC